MFSDLYIKQIGEDRKISGSSFKRQTFVSFHPQIIHTDYWKFILKSKRKMDNCHHNPNVLREPKCNLYIPWLQESCITYFWIFHRAQFLALHRLGHLFQPWLNICDISGTKNKYIMCVSGLHLRPTTLDFSNGDLDARKFHRRFCQVCKIMSSMLINNEVREIFQGYWWDHVGIFRKKEGFWIDSELTCKAIGRFWKN